jgi:hypothetical protein
LELEFLCPFRAFGKAKAFPKVLTGQGAKNVFAPEPQKTFQVFLGAGEISSISPYPPKMSLTALSRFWAKTAKAKRRLFTSPT